MKPIQVRTIDSPVGPLTLAGRDDRLSHLRMVDQTYEPSHDGWESNEAAFADAVRLLAASCMSQKCSFWTSRDWVLKHRPVTWCGARSRSSETKKA